MDASDQDVRRGAARELERAIEQLTEVASLPSLADSVVPFLERQRDYKAFWTKAKEVNALFKGSRLLREDRERLWSRHQQLCDEVKRLQELSQRDREAASHGNRDRIWFELKSARPICGWANSVSELEQAEAHLAKAVDVLKDKSVFMLNEHRNECWTEWKDLKRMAAERRERLLTLSYEALRSEIGPIGSAAADGDPHEALRDIKVFQERIRDADLDRERRQLLRDELQHWWDRAIGRIRERRGEARKRMIEAVQRKEQFISRLESQIEDLDEEVNSARTEEFASRVRGWIEDKYRKIREVQEEIVDLQEGIRDLTEKLGE